MTPASAPSSRLQDFVRDAERHRLYPRSLARLAFTAVSRVVTSMANDEATVVDIEKWLDGPGRIPANFVSKYEISPSTHATYVSRARKVLEDYYRCGGDVRAWTSRAASESKATPKSIELPLSDGRTAQLTFPHDLSRAEARTIVAQLEGLKAVFLARAEVEGDG